MSGKKYQPAKNPTLYFIGVTTAKSSIMKVFPKWAAYLGLHDARIQGADFQPHDDPESYREIVRFIKGDPLAMGALVTTHKIDLLKACRELFDELDPYALNLGEVSCIFKRDGKLVGHAKDPVSSGLALEAILPENYWKRTRANAFVMGAGGSAIAVTTYMMSPAHGSNRPSKIWVSNRTVPRLDEIRRIHGALELSTPREYVFTPRPEDNDRISNALPGHSVVINATGLGKDSPGSPITGNALFPRNGIAWDFNYRGSLEFLEQARKQAQIRNLRVEDGWIYFIHGWLQVISEVFHLPIPTHGNVIGDLSAIAARVRS